MAVTGIAGQSRTSDDLPNSPLHFRYEQKISKYDRMAGENGFEFIPSVFSHTGQIHGTFKRLIKEQICRKLISFEGEAIQSKNRWAIR